jgi:hypothetical protein
MIRHGKAATINDFLLIEKLFGCYVSDFPEIKDALPIETHLRYCALSRTKRGTGPNQIGVNRFYRRTHNGT